MLINDSSTYPSTVPPPTWIADTFIYEPKKCEEGEEDEEGEEGEEDEDGEEGEEGEEGA